MVTDPSGSQARTSRIAWYAGLSDTSRKGDGAATYSGCVSEISERPSRPC